MWRFQPGTQEIFLGRMFGSAQSGEKETPIVGHNRLASVSISLLCVVRANAGITPSYYKDSP